MCFLFFCCTVVDIKLDSNLCFVHVYTYILVLCICGYEQVKFARKRPPSVLTYVVPLAVRFYYRDAYTLKLVVWDPKKMLLIVDWCKYPVVLLAKLCCILISTFLSSHWKKK